MHERPKSKYSTDYYLYKGLKKISPKFCKIHPNVITIACLDKLCTQKFIKILCNLHTFDKIEFTYDDIVRSDLVKAYIIAKNKVLEFE